MKITQEMYIALFNGITDALTALDENDPAAARELLIYAQRRAEEIYVNEEPEEEASATAIMH